MDSGEERRRVRVVAREDWTNWKEEREGGTSPVAVDGIEKKANSNNSDSTDVEVKEDEGVVINANATGPMEWGVRALEEVVPGGHVSVEDPRSRDLIASAEITIAMDNSLLPWVVKPFLSLPPVPQCRQKGVSCPGRRRPRRLCVLSTVLALSNKKVNYTYTHTHMHRPPCFIQPPWTW